MGGDGVESDRNITDELTRFLRDNPGAPVVDNIAAALKDTRPKAQRRTDLLLACLIVVVAIELLHFVTPWGITGRRIAKEILSERALVARGGKHFAFG